MAAEAAEEVLLEPLAEPVEDAAAGVDPAAEPLAGADGAALVPPEAGAASLAAGTAAGSAVLAAPVPLSRKSVTYQPEPLS